MALPKALLQVVDPPQDFIPEESALRNAGFATAVVFQSDLKANNGWTQLAPVLDDPAVVAWALLGESESFTREIFCQMSLISLSLSRPIPPVTALILRGKGEEPEFPEILGHLKVFRDSSPFAAKMMASKFKPEPCHEPAFYLAAHVDPLVGIWLEIGPGESGVWNGFMAGVTGADVVAFGMGPRGVIPSKSVMDYPRLGIKGEWGGRTFSACEAANEIDRNTACFLKIDGWPQAIFRTERSEGGVNYASDGRVDWVELS